MKKLFLLFSIGILFCLQVQAQNTATWKGGTPGRNTEWNCPTNWREGRVPNEFSNVMIPDVSTRTFSYPVIETGTVEIYSLYCEPSASLTIMAGAQILIEDAPVNKPVYQNGGMAYVGEPRNNAIAQVSAGGY